MIEYYDAIFWLENSCAVGAPPGMEIADRQAKSLILSMGSALFIAADFP